MEAGVFALPRKSVVSNIEQTYFTRTPLPTSQRGVINFGDAPFDGISSGRFVGANAGTYLAMNVTAGTGIFPVDFQIGGTSRFKLDNNGNIVLFSSSLYAQRTVHAAATDATVLIQSSGAGFTNGNTAGTHLAIVGNSGTADLINLQNIAGTSTLLVDSLGNLTTIGALNDGMGLGAGGRLNNYYNFV